jgi:L-threonylcarbamoyladenylate synthase
MEIISNPAQDEIKKAARALKDGHLVAFPTETVYGLGADATNQNAVSRIYSVKSRPTNHPMIVHVSTIDKLDIWAVNIPDYAWQLAEKFWPGPMTLILKRSGVAKDFITGAQDNVGIRVPSHPVALRLLTEFESIGGLGVVAPSANIFGAVSPTTSDDVRIEIGDFLESKDLLMDGGDCTVGIESSIIDCTEQFPRILRPGAVTTTMVEDSTGIKVLKGVKDGSTRTPGSLKSHYSPKAKIVIGNIPKPGDGFLALSNIPTPSGVIRLASPENLEEYARLLYKSFRLADSKKISKIVIIIPQGSEIALAISDRIYKASY